MTAHDLADLNDLSNSKRFGASAHTLILVFSLLLCASGPVIVLWVTKFGIGMSPDSVIYVATARNVASGHGFLVPILSWSDPLDLDLAPMTHFPPLLPLALVVFPLLKLDPIVGARWLNALLFGANILSVAVVVYTYTRSSLYSLLVSWLALGSIALLQVHTWLWSEPLYLILTLWSLFFLAGFLESGQFHRLFWSAFVVSLAFLTRYVGVTLVITGTLALLLFDARPLRQKLTSILVFDIIACAPISSVWMLRNLFIADTLVDRPVAYHPISYERFRQGCDTITRWFFPSVLPLPLRLGLTVAVAILFVMSLLMSRRRRTVFSAGYVMMKVLSLFCLIYVAFLAISISFFDATTPLDDRILSPVFLCAIILFMLVIEYILPSLSSIVLKVGFVVCFVIFCSLWMTRAVRWTVGTSADGRGYASRMWRNSELMQKVRASNPGVDIVTNCPDGIYLLTGRRARMLPLRGDAYGLHQLSEYLRDRRSVIVYSDLVSWRGYLPSVQELLEMIPLERVEIAKDGAIYQYKDG